MGFAEVLTIVFVVLKATGNLDWSWWLVFSPELAAGVLYLLVLTGALAIWKRD
jgi:hypothetical protein